jgi:carbamoyl-phosphate synthase large subunit
VRILILPGTTLVAREIRLSLEGMRDLQLFGAGFDVSHSDIQLFCEYYFLKGGSSNENLNTIKQIVLNHGIEYIFLAHDQYLYDFKDFFEIAGAKIIGSNARAIDVTSFKSKTYNFFQKSLPTPKTFAFETARRLSDEFFVKPDRGQGSRGGFLARGADLTQESSKENVITEYLPGVEYTVDCFSSLDSELMYAAARERITTHQGVSTETKIVHLPFASDFATIISRDLGLSGAWFFQLKEDSKGAVKLLEIGLRIAGASGINRLRGVNLTQMHLFQTANQHVEVPRVDTNPYLSPHKVDLGFHYEEVFLDFDDTLVVGEIIRKSAETFLRKCGHQEIPVTVISRHFGNLKNALSTKYPDINFYKILHITDGSDKSNFMPNQKKVLFVDDSYSERKQVKGALMQNVLALDPSVFQLLNG